MRISLICSGALMILSTIGTPLRAEEWGSADLRDVGRDEEGYNWIAIKLRLEDGWKTYWEHAGQNGLDPVIALKNGDDPVDAEIHWPPPHLFVADNLPSVGYKGDVLIPISFKGDGNLELEADLGVCETVCIPISLKFNVDAKPGYSIEQFVIKGAPRAPEAPICDWSTEALAKLDENSHWLFVHERGMIAQKAPEDFERGQIYGLSEAEVYALPCPD